MDSRRRTNARSTLPITMGAILSCLFTIGVLSLLEVCRQRHLFGWSWGAKPDVEVIVLRALIIYSIQLGAVFIRYFFRRFDVVTDSLRFRLYISYFYLLVLSWVALVLKYFSGPIVDKVSAVVGLIGFTGIFVIGYFFALILKVYHNVEQKLAAAQEVSEGYYQRIITDALTGLPNRLHFEEDLAHVLKWAEQHQQKLSVLYLDLDRFKNINDTLGHTYGDLLLQAVAERIISRLPDGVALYRLGGDEFVILLEQSAEVQEATRLSQRLLQAMEQPFEIEGHELYISTSIGIAWYPEDGRDTETLFKNADMAMYRAKDQGRNNYQVYDAMMNDRALERLALENDLRKAIEREEFVVYYQPKVSIATGEMLGMEALVRWIHPERGLVSPGEFIPLAEETKLIVPISEWVMRTACAQVRSWHDAGYPLKLAVNISAHQFQQTNLVATVRQVLCETGLDPHALDLEITESITMVNVERAISTMHDLAKIGVRISIDDFGTGYSSLSYLKKFPIHTLKIDRSFVRDITTDADDAAIATAIIAMAHNLHLRVVAEGVETEAQLQFLRAHHCDEMQGFYISRPVPSAEFEKLLQQQSAHSA